MDAGVPNAMQLTEKVYENLQNTNFEDARLYGYVLGKIITNRARKGVSPFRAVGIEDVYATLKRFLFRHSDVLGEFVDSWDDFGVASDFDAAEFHGRLSAFISQQVTGRSRFPLGSEGPGAYLKNTLGASSQHGKDAEATLRPFIESLTQCLSPTFQEPLRYMELLTEHCDNRIEFVGSLNYDLVFEETCKARGITVDYGLSQWNEKKLVRFHGQSLKFAKLHGSIDWYENGDNLVISPARSTRLKRGMVFGAQSEKLVADGPYLQLRGEFEKALRRTNKVGVIGYSFQDEHVNSLLRIWLLTRKNAKLVILDPARLTNFASLGYGATVGIDNDAALNVDCVHVRGTAAGRVQEFMNEVLSDPVRSISERNPAGIRVV